jgi:hypothetical protein
MDAKEEHKEITVSPKEMKEEKRDNSKTLMCTFK